MARLRSCSSADTSKVARRKKSRRIWSRHSNNFARSVIAIRSLAHRLHAFPLCFLHTKQSAEGGWKWNATSMTRSAALTRRTSEARADRAAAPARGAQDSDLAHNALT